MMGRTAAARRIATGWVILLVTLLFLGLVQTPAHATTHLERRMLRLTNISRDRRDMHRLRLDSGRSNKARRHSAAMARSGEIYHTADPADFYLRGVRWSRWGENVGRTGTGLGELQDAFMASPLHRENILGTGFSKVAIGAVKRDGSTWVTLFFYG